MVLAVSNFDSDCTAEMVAERLEELKELVALVELELLVHFVGVHETMKSWDSLSTQGCEC